MKNFLLRLFTWWNGHTLGTAFHTWRKGEFVGEDQAGNRYFQLRGGTRRWVLYNGEADASSIPPGWNGWIHHRTDSPPEDYAPREWELPHQANLTGTAAAYRPPGSLAHARPETPGRPDYEPWSPE